MFVSKIRGLFLEVARFFCRQSFQTRLFKGWLLLSASGASGSVSLKSVGIRILCKITRGRWRGVGDFV